MNACSQPSGGQHRQRSAAKYWVLVVLWSVSVAGGGLVLSPMPLRAAEVAAAATEPASTGTLSVAPSDALRYPADRPAWIDAAPELSGKVHRWPVSSTPASTRQLSRDALQVQLRAAAETYVETLLDSAEAASAVELSDDWIEAHIDPDRRYTGSVDAGGEVLYEAAAELRFDRRDRDWLAAQWRAHQVHHRLLSLGAISAGSALLLVMATAGLSIVVRRGERSHAQHA